MTNRKRAWHAEAALDTLTHIVYGGRDVGELVDEDRQAALADLIGDLMHWSKREGFDFGAELNRAQRHFDHESRYGWDEEVPA